MWSCSPENQLYPGHIKRSIISKSKEVIPLLCSTLVRLVPRILSWFCNFAIGIPHHNIMDKREELCIQEDLTVREGRYITEDTSSGCTRSFFHFRLLPGRGVGVLPRHAPSSSRAFGNSLSLSRSFILSHFI